MTTNREIEVRIRELARTAEVPSPSERQLDRILARRGRGERITLPRPGSLRRSLWWLGPVAAAAGLLVLVRSSLHEAPERAAASLPDTVAAAEAGFLLPAPLMAQASGHPRFPTLRSLSGASLKPGRWFYSSWRAQRTVQPGDTLYGYGVATATWQDRPAWLVLNGRRLPSGAIEWRDSLWLTRDSLVPLFRIGHFGENGRIEQTWRDGDVLTGETVNGYTAWRRRPIVDPTRNPAEGVTIQWYQFLATLQSGELGPGWKRSLEMPFGVLQQNTYTFFLDLEVLGPETITVPAGTFECWKVALGRGPNAHHLWADRRTGWIIARSATLHDRERYRQELVYGEAGE